MQRERSHGVKRREGIAILVTTIALVLVAMIGLTSLEHTREEATSGGRSRNVARTLHAADAGIEFARNRVAQTPPNLNAFSLTLLDGAEVESRQRADTAPQTLTEIGLSGTTSGYSLNTGAATVNSRIYQVNVTGTAGSAVVEVEARFGVAEPGSGSY
jgi:Tfp pilus assembly protein PilX